MLKGDEAIMTGLLMGIIFGLITASVLSLASVGLTLQFGVTNFVNFAYGTFLTIGAYFTYTLNQDLHINIWLAMIISAIFTAIVAFIINRIVILPFLNRKASLFILLVVTIGLSLFLENAVNAIWGAKFRQFSDSAGGLIHLGPLIITVQQIIIMGIAVVAMIGIHILLRFTSLGKAMRAMSDDSELARVSGIKINRIRDLTWLLSGFLAGISGVILAINVNTFTPSLGSDFLFVIFAAVILGGIGSPYGSMLGSLVIGIVMEVSASFIDSSYKIVIAFAILIIVLLIRPEGIFRMRGKH